MRCAGIPAYGVQMANFHQKMKMMNLQYFCIFKLTIYLMASEIFGGVFFMWKAYQLSINNKNLRILTKRSPVAYHLPGALLPPVTTGSL